MRRAGAALVLVPAAWTAVACLAPSSSAAAPEPSDGPALVVDDQRFAVAIGEDWTARLVVVDPDGALDDVVPSPTTAGTAAGPGLTTAVSTTPVSNRPPAASRPTTPAAPDATVTVGIGRRLEDREALAGLTDPDELPTTDEVVVPLAEVLTRSDDVDTLQLQIPVQERAGRPSLTVRTPGLYPLTITLTVDDDVVAATTTSIQAVGDEVGDDPPLGIAVTAALSDPGPVPDAAAARTAREELAALDAYGELTDAPLSLALPPSLDEELADDDDLRAGVAEALAGGELLALPYLTLDPSAAVAVGRVDAFSREVRRGEDALASVLPGISVRRSGWLVLEPLSRPAAAAMRDPLGYRLLVMDHATYESLPGNIGTFLDSSLAVDIELGGGETMQGAVVSPLGRLLDEGAAGARTPTERAIQILTALLVNRQELGADLHRNVVLTADGFELPDGATVDALDRLGSESPDIRLITLSDLVGTTDTMLVGDDPVTLSLPERAGDDLTARTERIDLVRVSAESAASMVERRDQRTRWLADLDRLVSTGLTDEQVDVELDRITREIDGVFNSIQLPEPFTFTLTGRTSELRLNIRNNADEDRTVVVRALSPKLRFPAGDQTMTLPPGVTEVVIPVEARANGSSSVEIQLLTPVFNQRLGPSAFLEARVNAMSGLGPLITGIAIVLLLSCWFSHFRRRRRARLAALAVVDEYDPDPVVSPDAAEATAVTVPDSVPDP